MAHEILWTALIVELEFRLRLVNSKHGINNMFLQLQVLF